MTGRRSEGVAKGYPWGPGGDRWTYEVWTANDIKLAILFQYNTRLMKVVQRFENIQERDPDPEVFQDSEGLPGPNRNRRLHARAKGCF